MADFLEPLFGPLKGKFRRWRDQGDGTHAEVVAAKVEDGNIAPLGYQQILDLAAATALTIPEGATRALIQASMQTVRWRDDGTNPTASVGMKLLANAEIWYVGSLSAIRFIEEAAGAKLNVSYYA
jgi:hypothetical protein